MIVSCMNSVLLCSWDCHMFLGVVPVDALVWPVTGLMTDFYHKIYIVFKDLITTGPVRVFHNCLDKSSYSFIEVGA